MCSYDVHVDFGGSKALRTLRERLRTRGIRLMLDFVPNHTAIDHPWVSEHPDYYVAGSASDLTQKPADYFKAETSLGKGFWLMDAILIFQVGLTRRSSTTETQRFNP